MGAERDEIAKLREGARMLGKVVVGHSRAMEAARIELAQGSAEKAMEWILDSLPDVWDDPETKWDGKESANEWWDRTDSFYRAAEAPAVPSPPVAAALDRVEAVVLCPGCLHDGVLELTLERAEAAEAKLAAIESHCRGHLQLSGICCPHLAHEILAIISSEEEN